MADQGLTVNEEQLVLFKETMQLQRDELAEQAKRNRADEAIETRRIAADIEVHSKNLEHAGKVLTAQATDRDQIRSFWSVQIGRFCWIVAGIMLVACIICGYAIAKGQTAAVFDAVKTLGTHALALLGGVGADRLWIHRRKTGISNPTDNSK